jgi:drug/metabolite transporter (DMT)-like permease
MLAVALSLAASLSWGAADFLGGVSARRHPLWAVVVLSQLAGLALALVLVVAFAGPPPAAGRLALAAAAGVAGAVAIAAFYRALAIGTMSVVAPVVATSAVIPVLAGLAAGERPARLQVVGIALALVGVVLAARERSESRASRARLARSVALALVAAIGLGILLVGLQVAGEGGPLWALLAARAASVLALVVATLVVRPRLAVRPAALPSLLVLGVLDTGANALFVLATGEGLRSVVAVLASLYPVVTVLLARVLLGERLAGLQAAGVGLALTGVAALAAG